MYYWIAVRKKNLIILFTFANRFYGIYLPLHQKCTV